VANLVLHRTCGLGPAAEEGARQAREEGVVGRQQREERVNEMSKEGFLELISKGGKSAVAT
jgi:hypothetical protein